MKAIILAAGKGLSRSERAEAVPTCLMKVKNKTILQRQIDILKKYKINDITVIVGKEGSCWTKGNINRIKRISKDIIINPHNAVTSSSSSLLLGLLHFKESSVLIIDGDLIFEDVVIKTILKNKHKSVILIESVRPNTKNTYVKTKNELVNEIGCATKTNEIYAGLMKIDKRLYKKIKNELENNKDKKLEFADIINKNLKDFPVYAINLEKIDGDVGEILGLKPLVGGSFANTNVLSKHVRKTDYIVRKEAIEGRQKLIDEINWIKNLPPDLVPYFPKLVNYHINKKSAWYDMEYIPLPTLRSMLVNKTLSKEDALYILKELVKLSFSKIYTKRISNNTKDYAKEIHLKRIKERLNFTNQKSDIMNKIINSDYIYINNKKYLNLPFIIKIIEEDESLLKKLEPPYLCMVHGDLHFDNFVVDICQKPMIKFYLLDPRGLDDTYGYCYDLGKLWHSFHGKYDLTHEGLFNNEYTFNGNCFVSKIKATDPELVFVYDYLYKNIREYLSKILLQRRDINWELRTEFSEVSHFCSVMPFHLKYDNKEKVAIALYLMGVKLANEFVSKYCKGYRKGVLKKKYININTIEDYNLAKKLFK